MSYGGGYGGHHGGGFNSMPQHPNSMPQVAQPVVKESFFFGWVQNKDLQKTESLSKLNVVDEKNPNSPVKLGIDGGHLLRLLESDVRQDSQHLYYLASAIPFRAREFLTHFLNSAKECNIQPVIVFDGMQPEGMRDEQARTAPIPWGKIMGLTNPQCPMPPVRGGRNTPPPNQSRGNYHVDYLADLSNEEREALLHRASTCTLQYDEDFVNWVIRFLLDEGAEVYRAPYWAWPQLACFLHKSNRFIGDIFGPPEVLAFDGVDRLVLEVDFHKKTFKYITKRDCIARLEQDTGLTGSFCDPEFFRICLMLDSGHKNLASFATQPRYQSFEGLVKYAHDTGIKESIANFPVLNWVYTIIQRALVFTVKGEVKPLADLGGKTTPSINPVALGKVFGCRLPACFYYFLFCNAITPQTLSAVVNSKICDPPMLCETKEGRVAVERVLPLRTQIVFQMVQQLQSNCTDHHNYFQSDFSLMWLRNNTTVPILRPPQITLDEWNNIREDDKPDFGSVLDYAVNATRDAKYTTVAQALSAVHLKALDLLGYFTHATHNNSTEVSGKSVYSDALAYCNGPCTDHAVLLIELLRTRSLTDAPFPQGPADFIGDDYSRKGFRFFMRLVSLVPVDLRAPYNGPTHPGLLSFNAIVKHLHRTLRSLTEVVGLTLFLQNRIDFHLSEYQKFPTGLPFKEPIGIIAGLVAHFLLEGPTDPATKQDWQNLTSPARRYEYLATVFPDIKDVKQVVSDIFHFWDIGVVMLLQLSTDDTPTVDGEIINVARTFHNEFIIGLAEKYDIRLSNRDTAVSAQN